MGTEGVPRDGGKGILPRRRWDYWGVGVHFCLEEAGLGLSGMEVPRAGGGLEILAHLHQSQWGAGGSEVVRAMVQNPQGERLLLQAAGLFYELMSLLIITCSGSRHLLLITLLLLCNTLSYMCGSGQM